MEDRKIGSYYQIYVCSKCQHRMSNHTKMYSSAICPYCGHDGGCTVCDTTKVIIRKVKHLRPNHKWYQILESKYTKVTYEGKDSFSREWLKKNP